MWRDRIERSLAVPPGLQPGPFPLRCNATYIAKLGRQPTRSITVVMLQMLVHWSLYLYYAPRGRLAREIDRHANDSSWGLP